MRRPSIGLTRRLFAVLMSIALSAQGVPVLPAHAEEVTVTANDATLQVDERDEDSVPVEGTLTSTIAVDGEGAYTVTMSFGKDAGIPEGSELHARLADADKSADEARQSRLEQALELGPQDCLMGAQRIALWITCDEKEIEPTSCVDVTIETNALDPTHAAYAEVALLADDETADERLEVENLTENTSEPQTVTLRFSATRLGTVGLARVATRQSVWTGAGLEVFVLTPRQGAAVTVQDVDVPTLEEGVFPLAGLNVCVDPCPAYGSTVWFEALRSEEGALEEDALGGVTAYGMRDGVLGDWLFGPEGTTEPVAFPANKEPLVLVRDGGQVEPTEDLSLAKGEASGADADLNALVLGVQDEQETTELSSFFKVRASAKNYARTATVTYVDDAGNPLLGTVTGTLPISYTGSGSESNETNTIDMYGFTDKLDPAIAGEYDFSRVFVQLTAENQKDFRYMQVGDDTAIGGGSTSTYRAYLYQESVTQNASGQDYSGTWYNLANGGNIDNMYIEFFHVGEASFYALDTRGDPVPGAVFSLYTDSECYTPLEYKNKEVTATANRRGLVSFGKIPRGTYYMKETVVPEGYKKTTTIHEVVVDGQAAIPNIVHEDDDGSVIIADVLKMTLTKEWDDGREHADDQVEVCVYANGEVAGEVTLSAKNNWTQTLDGLDPNEAYMVTETRVTSGDADVTNSWIPQITYEEKETRSEYYKADEFRRGKQYVVLTTTSGGTRALSGGDKLATTPLQANEEGAQIVGEVTNDMLWSVESLTKDGVIALRNQGSESYLDRGSRWMLNAEYPVPLYVRHINDAGKIKFYHRANLNSATSNYLYVWSSGNREGAVDNYANNASQAATFDIYRKVNVRAVDVAITNKATRYPMLIKNVSYPRATALPGMSFELYALEDYEQHGVGAQPLNTLVAGEDGYLRDEGMGPQLELSAGAYVLLQTSDLQEEGYAPLEKPVRFTITRGGALRVAQSDQEIADFLYSTTVEMEQVTYPMLQIPNNKPATVEIAFEVEGDYGDKTRTFEFALELPEGVNQLSGSIDGMPVTFDDENLTFGLKHGQVLRLDHVPATESYVITQEDPGSYEPAAEAVTPNTVAVLASGDDAWTATLSNIAGTDAEPSRVRIVNTLANGSVPATGIEDNTCVWGMVVVISSLLLCAVRKGTHLTRWGKKKGHAT